MHHRFGCTGDESEGEGDADTEEEGGCCGAEEREPVSDRVRRSVSSVPIATRRISPMRPNTKRLKKDETSRGRNRIIAYTPKTLSTPWTMRVRRGEEESEENKSLRGKGGGIRSECNRS